MIYLRNTIRDIPILSADKVNIVKWWIDGSFAVHLELKIQTGETMSMGIGSLYNTS